ncbi:MAG: response regulator, partial [Oligoflexales bacterium]|nr:response regulator [Oligoflexales bacterium]
MSFKKADDPARIFSFASTVFLLFVICSAPSAFSSSNLIFQYGFQLGSIAQISILSVYLGITFLKMIKASKCEVKDMKNSLESLNLTLEDRIKEQTDEIKAANEAMKKAYEQKTHFFQNVSHEFRTPLTLILNSLENLKNRDSQNEDVIMATQNSRRLLRLVNEFLDYQKYSSETLKMNLSSINISKFLKACCQSFEAICRSKNIGLVVDIKTDTDLYIMAQIDAMEKIVFNFFSNALKFSPEGQSITISLFKNDDTAVLSVTDNGPGISIENQAKLFKTFSQIDNQDSKPVHGSGLGLALVKELAEAMNGGVFVESAPLRGSTFGVRFPVCVPMLEHNDILIIDDDDEVLFYLKRRLEVAGYKVSTATTIDEARKLFTEFRFISILCDFYLKDEKGIDFLVEVAEKSPETIRLIMTGYTYIDDTNKIINNAKVTKIYVKPIDLKDLMADLQKFKNAHKSAGHHDTDLTNYLPKDDYLMDFEDEKDDEPLKSDEKLAAEKGRLILVVDDLKEMRKLIAKILRKKSYRVATANDGDEGLYKATELRPDLAIIDWMMPVVSGIEMLECMAKDKRLSTIPTIMLTAKSDEISKSIATKKGAHAYIGKPFDETELLNTVENMIKLKESAEKIDALNKDISENVLKRFLPRRLVADICSGKKVLEDKPKLMDVTILFANLMDFTDKAEEMGPYIISEILNSYFNMMTKIIFAHNGTIDKFLGDGIMAIFGAPEEMSSDKQV